MIRIKPGINVLKYILRACDNASVFAKNLLCGAGCKVFASSRTCSPFEGIYDRSVVGLLDRDERVVPWSGIMGTWPFMRRKVLRLK